MSDANTIPVKCPGCQAGFDVPVSLSGKTIRCTSWRVSWTSSVDSETAPLEITDLCISGVVGPSAVPEVVLASSAFAWSPNDRAPAGASADPVEPPPLSASEPPPEALDSDMSAELPSSPGEEQAARKAVMVIAVRMPAARRRAVGSLLMPLRRGGVRGWFRAGRGRD